MGAETPVPRRLYVYNGGFLKTRRIRRILGLSGWSVTLGKPGPGDAVGVWGKSPTSPRGETVARHTESEILRVEDAFLRSVLPGRSGSEPLGLCLDQSGVHFDSSHPSDLETLLATHPMDDTTMLNRARAAATRLRIEHLSKYNAFKPTAALPEAPYVLVIDQTRDDASIAHGGANAATFAEMLVFAQTEHPGNRIVIKSHPETMAGHRNGHFDADVENERITLLDSPVSPWALMEGATAVYTVSSQLGFEAIYAGHRPRVFGQPFYAGWGLSDDENPVARRQRKLTRAQLFAGAMILYPRWYDPHSDRLCELEDVINSLGAQSRAWRQDNQGYVALNMRRWKHRHLSQFFGQTAPIQYETDPGKAVTLAMETGRPLLIWGDGAAQLPDLHGARVARVEDGFLRSTGLGAKLTPPLSLALDDLGIYYDPTGPSRLEQHINASVNLDQAALDRGTRLVQSIRRHGLSKYNTPGAGPGDLPDGQRILVVGQVEDDKSVIKGCTTVTTNRDLLRAARRDNPNAVIIYKPHPDVEASLRKGRIETDEIATLADHVLADCNPIEAIDACDEIWTMTSTLGFEALIRDKPVTCLGMPFYAGWGLTNDLQPGPDRRQERPSLVGLVHACLIDYPRYFDPVSGLPCPVETAVERLVNGVPKPGPWSRFVARLQSMTRYFRGS